MLRGHRHAVVAFNLRFDDACMSEECSAYSLNTVDRLWHTVMNIWLKKNKLPPVLTFR